MEQSFAEKATIPTDIQEELNLGGLKREIMKAMPWDSQATNHFATMSPQEIFELIPSINSIHERGYGLLFENVSRKLLLKESVNPKITELRTLLDQIFITQAHTSLGLGAIPDFLEIDDNFEIKKVFECKASKRQYRMKGNQSTNILETLRGLIQALQEPNPPIKIAPFLARINEVTGGKLKLADDVQYVYVLPQELKNKELEKSLERKGFGVEYIPLSKDDATAMYRAVLSHSTNNKPTERETISSSAFRSKNNR